MIYLQQKSGQQLHLVYEIENGFTQPICGFKVSGYRMTINVPMGHACKRCTKRINSSKFNPNEFIKKFL